MRSFKVCTILLEITSVAYNGPENIYRVIQIFGEQHFVGNSFLPTPSYNGSL